MDTLENAIREAKGGARTVGELLREVGRLSPQAAQLIEEDLANPEMSLEKCFDALHAYARKHQSGGFWGCAVFRVDPENEAVKVILDFYKIPPEWLSSAAAEPVPKATPASGIGGKIDLLDLL